ncbi:hypothetical protein B296_00007489 [Ensete ventricosum]|uniref:Uncharacterized protein n=1 Tax=Ensete ventricosum TaxID=4639 RepID=A0A426XSK7_ENSVE|nr:hypothetical protein B296_00007489 [Ensete ventricosum]
MVRPPTGVTGHGQPPCRGGRLWPRLWRQPLAKGGCAARGNASIDIDGIMALGVMWMPFSYSFLRSWAVDPRSSLGKTFSIMVHSSVKLWK